MTLLAVQVEYMISDKSKSDKEDLLKICSQLIKMVSLKFTGFIWKAFPIQLSLELFLETQSDH